MNFSNITNVINFYNTDKNDKHKSIYELFKKNATDDSILFNHFHKTEGFGELSFSWNWYLLVNNMPSNFNFLEIGVYKGRVLSIIQLISNLLNKMPKIYGITPLENVGDKYSTYTKSNYLDDIKRSFSINNLSFDNVNIIKGYSQDINIINQVKDIQYDIIFIDGCHDYDIVCLDIENYTPLLKKNGYLVLDDASSLLPNAFGQFLGHNDVGKAIQNKLDNNKNFKHLYAVGHNRVWMKL